MWEMLCSKVQAPTFEQVILLDEGKLTNVHDGQFFTGHYLSNDMAHRILRMGITGTVLVPLGELLHLSTAQLAPVLGVDRATARRYAQHDQVLPMHSAETVLRLAELEALALDVFASEEAAHGWLKSSHPMLDESPIDAASTSYGAQRVREILTAIKYGGVA